MCVASRTSSTKSLITSPSCWRSAPAHEAATAAGTSAAAVNQSRRGKGAKNKKKGKPKFVKPVGTTDEMGNGKQQFDSEKGSLLAPRGAL